MNTLENIYAQLGENICLCPFFGAFYQTNNIATEPTKNTVRPCSVIGYNMLHDWAVDNHSIAQTRNNTRWKQLRQDLIDGKLQNLLSCQGCVQNEQKGATSPRLMSNKFFSQHLDVDIVEKVQNIMQNNNTVFDVQMIDYYPSNYCNFSCVMCDGGASSQRHTFEIQVLGKKGKIIINESDPDFFQLLSQVKVLNFTGGETVLQKQVHEIIDYLIEQNLSSQMLITLLSNGSSSPAPLVEKFKKFKNVIYNVSIDGVGAVIEYQRRGCVWPEVERNALELMKHPLIGCVMNFVLTAINALNIMDFVDWCYRHELGHVKLPTKQEDIRTFYNISPVFRVDYLGVGTMPTELRNLALQRLAEGKIKYQQFPTSDLVNHVLAMINHFTKVIDNTPYNPDYLVPFIEHIRKEDSVSKHTLAEVVPEWAPYFQS